MEYRAFQCVLSSCGWIRVSIHTILADGDNRAWWDQRAGLCFNPHHPCGWRPGDAPALVGDVPISIHTILADRDYSSSTGARMTTLFQSTPSTKDSGLFTSLYAAL